MVTADMAVLRCRRELDAPTAEPTPHHASHHSAHYSSNRAVVSGSTAPLTTANPQVSAGWPLTTRPEKLKKVRAPLLLADGSAPAWPSLAQLVDEPVPHWAAACRSLDPFSVPVWDSSSIPHLVSLRDEQTDHDPPRR